jgi:hypothetical protein
MADIRTRDIIMCTTPPLLPSDRCPLDGWMQEGTTTMTI